MIISDDTYDRIHQCMVNAINDKYRTTIDKAVNVAAIVTQEAKELIEDELDELKDYSVETQTEDVNGNKIIIKIEGEDD